MEIPNTDNKEQPKIPSDKVIEEIIDEAIQEKQNLDSRKIRLYKVMPSIRNDGGSKLQRNEPCPCGSKLKFKKCCWSTLK